MRRLTCTQRMEADGEPHYDPDRGCPALSNLYDMGIRPHAWACKHDVHVSIPTPMFANDINVVEHRNDSGSELRWEAQGDEQGSHAAWPDSA